MALRALVLVASLRPTTQQGKEEDPNILGRIELETTQVEPVNVRALCFEGLGPVSYTHLTLPTILIV